MQIRYLTALLLSIGVTVTSCNMTEEYSIPEIAWPVLQKAGADTLTLNIDSIMAVRIPIKPLYDKPGYDTAAANSFKALAKSTGGRLQLVASPDLLVQQIRRVIEANGTNDADLLILMDKTGSMADDIVQVKTGLNNIISALGKYRHLRLAVALYGDHHADTGNWYSYRSFETDYEAARGFIDSIAVVGGGDTPESVYEGFFETMGKDFWRSPKKRMIMLIGDAPPLEAPLSTHTMAEVIRRAHEGGVTMNFYPILIGAGAVTPDTGGVAPIPYTDAGPKSLFNHIYPVPSTGVVQMDLSAAGDYHLEIFNAGGHLIHQETVSSRHWQHDFSSQANGVYLLRVSGGDHTFQTGKFILNR